MSIKENVKSIHFQDNGQFGESKVKITLNDGDVHLMMAHIEGGKDEVLNDLDNGEFDFIGTIPFCLFTSNEEEIAEWHNENTRATLIYGE